MVQGSANQGQARRVSNDWVQGSSGSLSSLTTTASAIPDEQLLGEIAALDTTVGPGSTVMTSVLRC